MKTALLIATAMFAMGAFVGVGHTGPIYTVTAANGATAEADFTFGTNMLTVVLTNTSINPSDVAFNLSALTFTFASPVAGGALSGASSPHLRTVIKHTGFPDDRSYTDAAGPNTVAGVGWVFSQTLSTYMLDVLSGVGHAGPAHTIIGLPAIDNKYDSSNGSIAGNGSHNPFLANSVTFNFIFASGVNIFSVLTSVRFQFGTEDSNFISGVCETGCGITHGGDVTEPSALALIGIALLSLVGLGYRRRRTAKSQRPPALG